MLNELLLMDYFCFFNRNMNLKVEEHLWWKLQELVICALCSFLLAKVKKVQVVISKRLQFLGVKNPKLLQFMLKLLCLKHKYYILVPCCSILLGNDRVREILIGIFISFEFEVFIKQIAGGYSQKLEKPNVNVQVYLVDIVQHLMITRQFCWR